MYSIRLTVGQQIRNLNSKGTWLKPGQRGIHRYSDKEEAEAMAATVRASMAKTGINGTVAVIPVQKAPSLRFGIRWIAENDETAVMNADAIAAFPTVMLLADLFGKTPEEVAEQVLRIRLAGGDAPEDEE